jgi:PadR family transcriptional regulator, regulatory protein PadR
MLDQMAKGDQLGSFELMVMLALIRLGENAYGVPLCEQLEKRTGRTMAVGSVYAALERLEGKGFVKSELGEATPERGGRAKKYFRLSAKGLKQVRETQRALVKLWHGLPELEGGKA